MRRSFLGGNNKKDDDNDENKKDDLDHAGSLLLSKTKRKRKNTIKSKFRFPKLLLVFLAGCLFFSSLSLHQQQQRRMHEEEKNNNNNFKSSLSLTEKVKSAHREMARYVRVRDEKTKVIWRRKKRRTEEKDDKEELDEEDFSSDGMIKALKKNNNNNDDDEDYVLTHHRALLPRPRFLIGGASRRAMAALSLSSSSDSSESSTSGVEGGDGRGGEDGRGARKSSLMFEGRRKVPKDLPLVPEIPERLKRADAEYVTERRVIPVKPRIAPERPRGGGQTKKSSGSGDDDEEDERNSAEKNNKPSPKVASSSSSESSNAPTLKAEREEPQEHDEDEHEEEAQEAEDSTSNSSHEDVEELSPEQKPTPMQKAVLKAATYRLGGTKLKKLLDTDVDIFLSKSTLNDIDPDDEKRNKITCGGKPVMQVKTYDQLRDAVPELSEYIPDEDDVHTRGGVKPDAKTLGRRCAVVGNSGSLLDHTYGAEIDSHDAVIRFNAAPTKGYEKHVGKKTTIRVQNIDNLGFREPRDEMLVFTARDEKTFRHFSEYQKKQFSKHGKEKTHIQRVFNPQFWCHVWDWVDRRKLKPSSGFAGVVLALRACSSKEKVSLYGFSHNATQFHYFNRLSEKVTEKEVYTYHPLAEESEAYRFLSFHRRLVKKN
jgi:hypothetical protein